MKIDVRWSLIVLLSVLSSFALLLSPGNAQTFLPEITSGPKDTIGAGTRGIGDDIAARAALIIGNSNYNFAPKHRSSKNDAQDIEAALTRLGFVVHHADDLAFGEMLKALQEFSDKASRAELALVFYSGYGIDIDHRNYLLPIDAKLEIDTDIELEGIPLDVVMTTLDQVRGHRLILLDASRINPFVASMRSSSPQRSIGRGLSEVKPAAGTLVSFAAKAGTTSAVGVGRNSPYTTAILSHLLKPGIKIDDFFRLIRDHVISVTGGKQEPKTYGSLAGEVGFLVPQKSETQAETKTILKRDSGNDLQKEIARWQAIKDTDDPSLLEKFAARFPDSMFVVAAQSRARLLRGQN